MPAILLCKRGGNVTVGPTVERLANQSNVWGKSIRKGSAGWADPFSFSQPSTVPAMPLVLFLTVHPPSGLVWSGSLQSVWSSNQQDHTRPLSVSLSNGKPSRLFCPVLSNKQ